MPEDLPYTIAEFEAEARKKIPPPVWDAFFGGYGEPRWETLDENIDALKRIKLRSRVITGVAQPSLETSVLGQRIDLPVMVAPTGGLIWQVCNPECEPGAARGAGKMGTVMVLPTTANYSIEEVAEAATGPLWFQLYVFKDRELNKILIERAEKAGYKALVVTVDNVTGTRGRSPKSGRELTESVVEVLDPTRLLRNFFDIDRPNLPTIADFHNDFEHALSWSDIDEVRSQTSLPMVIKGIQTAEDAGLCVEHGMDGLVISNHGGLFLDCSRGTVDALPEIVDAVGGRLEVYMDGGVRRGSDVLKALALGARAVLIGRPTLWGLTVAGADGVAAVLATLKRELAFAAGVAGVTDITNIDRSMVAKPLQRWD